MRKICKRTLAVLLAAILLVGAAPAAGLAGVSDFFAVTAAAETVSGQCGGNLTWALIKETGALTVSGTGKMHDFGWDSPPAPWSEDLACITTVTIESGVSSIGKNAFSSCRRLTSVSIPASVTEIGESAFSGCVRLANVTIPNGVTSINDYAFEYCTSLVNITIPDSVTSIGYGVFFHCEKLARVSIGSGLTEIGGGVFLWCPKLTSITVDANNACFSSDANGVLFDKHKTVLFQYPVGCPLASYTIPAGVSYIGYGAFFYCKNLTNVTISGNDMPSISFAAFLGCLSLRHITLPETIASIGEDAFGLCKNLQDVTIPENVTEIDDGAFYDCASLSQITIPRRVERIGNGVFGGCDSLKAISVDSRNPYYSSDADGMLYNKSTGDLIWHPVANPPWEERKSDGVEDGFFLFADAGKTDLIACHSAAQGVVDIPEGVTTIRSGTFSGCRQIHKVNLPRSLKRIGSGAFFGSGITSVHIPRSVESIEEYALMCGTILRWSHLFEPTLQTITADDANPFFTAVDNVLYSKDKTELLQYPIGKKDTVFAVPEGVKAVCRSAFTGAWNLEKIVLPTSADPDETDVAIFDGSLEDFNMSDCTVYVPAGARWKAWAEEEDGNDLRVEQMTDIRVRSMPAKTTYYPGETLDLAGLVIEAIYENGDALPLPYAAQTDVTTLSRTGVQTVTVSYGGFKTSFAVTVGTVTPDTPVLGGISVEGCTLQAKSTNQLSPNVQSNGRKYKLTYHSSDDRIASVDENGKVTAKKAGSVTITVTATPTETVGQSVSATCTVKVEYSFLQWLIVIFLFGFLWY